MYFFFVIMMAKPQDIVNVKVASLTEFAFL